MTMTKSFYKLELDAYKFEDREYRNIFLTQLAESEGQARQMITGLGLDEKDFVLKSVAKTQLQKFNNNLRKLR
jgi:hypothetical protein